METIPHHLVAHEFGTDDVNRRLAILSVHQGRWTVPNVSAREAWVGWTLCETVGSYPAFSGTHLPFPFECIGSLLSGTLRDNRGWLVVDVSLSPYRDIQLVWWLGRGKEESRRYECQGVWSLRSCTPFPMPWAFSLSSHLWCGTLSKALFRSRYIISTGDPSSTHFVTSSKNITYLLSITSPLEIHVEMGSSSYF